MLIILLASTASTATLAGSTEFLAHDRSSPDLGLVSSKEQLYDLNFDASYATQMQFKQLDRYLIAAVRFDCAD
jgi:hypothetical protein